MLGRATRPQSRKKIKWASFGALSSERKYFLNKNDHFYIDLAKIAHLVFGQQRIPDERSGKVSVEIRGTRKAKKRIMLSASFFGGFSLKVPMLSYLGRAKRTNNRAYGGETRLPNGISTKI